MMLSCTGGVEEPAQWAETGLAGAKPRAWSLDRHHVGRLEQTARRGRRLREGLGEV